MPLVDHGMHIKTVNTQNSLTHSYDKTNSIETSSSFYNQVISNIFATKGCLSLFNHFIDMTTTLMSPFFVKKKHVFVGKKHVFSTKIDSLMLGSCL